MTHNTIYARGCTSMDTEVHANPAHELIAVNVVDLVHNCDRLRFTADVSGVQEDPPI